MTDYTSFKNLLETERVRIIKDLTPIAVYDTVTGDWEAIPDAGELDESDENNAADAVEEWNERHATVSALETTFRDIERALEKISSGTYGYCEVGGEPIELPRLEILPTARTCTVHMEQEDLLSL